MKKLKLLTFLIVPAIAVPIAMNLTSCALYTGDIFNINYADYDGTKTLQDEKSVSASLHSLLWGTKSVNDGNYILFIGHSSANSASSYLMGQSSFGKDNSSITLNNNDKNLPAGIKASTTINDHDIAVVTYFLTDTNASEPICGSGNTTSPEYRKDDPVSPYAKWGTDDETANDDHVKDDYVRTDSAAKNYRSIMSTVSTLYKLGDNVANDFLGVQAVKGKIIGTSGQIKTSPFNGVDDFVKWVADNWTTGENWK